MRHDRNLIVFFLAVGLTFAIQYTFHIKIMRPFTQTFCFWGGKFSVWE